MYSAKRQMAIREKSLAEASSWIASTRGFQDIQKRFMDGGELLAERAAASNSHLKDEFVRTLAS